MTVGLRNFCLGNRALLCALLCCSLCRVVVAQNTCACTCCTGNYCTPTSIGDTTANPCDSNACISAFPSQCPDSTQSGTTEASSVSSTSSTPPAFTSSTYQSASGAIALDVSSVSQECKNDGSFVCSQAYSVAVAGNGLTLTTTSGTANDGCYTGSATIQDNGADATGTFGDGADVFTATNDGDYISVDVGNGACDGNYYVTSGGPILGVTKHTSGSVPFATKPFAALLLGLLVMALCVLG